MPNEPIFSVNPQRRRELEHALADLVLRFGATASPDLESKVSRCVMQIEEALAESSTDSKSLSPLDVVRIRASKFAASLTPAALYRDSERLAALRAEIQVMALAFVGGSGAQGSRFPPGQRK